MISELIRKCRSYRKFKEDKGLDDKMLVSFIENAALTPSGSNLQPLRYKIVNDRKDNAELFQHLKWAGYLKDWDGPEKGQRPAAYILILGDLSIRKEFGADLGIAAYAITLSAAEKDIGSCMIGSIDRKEVCAYFDIPEGYELLLVIALGYPDEKVVLEKAQGGDIKYYRDKDQVHHVPKRDPDEIILV